MNEALKTYSVPMIIALAVLALVQLVKSDKIPITIPPRARPWVAIGLALVAAIATRVIQGSDIGAAVLEGIGAGLTSIGLFEAGSSVKPGSPPTPPSTPPSDREAPTDPPAAPPPDLPSGALRWALAMTFALLAFGCGAVQQVAQVSAEIIARAEPCLMAQYEAAQEACLERTIDAERRGCVADVQRAWKPVIDALVQLRTVRCEIEPAKCEAQR